jgi:putative nucleotidyltransferase with HDIG domain
MKLSIKNVLKHIPFLKTTNGLRDRSWLESIRTPAYRKWFIGIGTALVLTFFLSPSLQLPYKEYKAGDIAFQKIKSTQDMLVEDEKSTQEKRMEAERTVLSVYDYDPSILSAAEKRIDASFPSLAASVRQAFTQKEWQLLERERFKPAFGEAVLKLIGPILKKGVINDRDLLDLDTEKGITIRDRLSRQEKKTLPPFAFLDLKEAGNKLRSQSELLPTRLGKEFPAIALKIAEHLLRPNLTFNMAETDDRKAKARASVQPVYFQMNRGEVIVRDGERVQEEHLVKIKALWKTQEKGHFLIVLLGLGLLTFFVLASLYEFSTRNIRKISLSQKDLLFLSTVLLGNIALLKLLQLIADILGGEFFSIPSSSYLYLFPLATGAMLVRIVLYSEAAIIFAILSSFFSAVLMGNQLFFFIFTLVGGVVGAHKVARCEQRTILIKAGLMVGGINFVMILAYNMISGGLFRMGLLSDLIMGFLGGIIASVLLLGLTPIIESLFGYTTDIKLLELANMDTPLLKDLVLQAPGTYHHCVMVGNLVEAAAKSISANPLLARVSAYYHDIGKLKKPVYFIENTGGSDNRHDRISPTMSSLVLISHVKDGVELAREHRLGDRIARIIQQHHGTSLTSFFYQKAKAKENPDMDFMNEKDFRYPGPKPQTKEAGLVMLADAVEASSRTLTDPTPASIQRLIQKIINQIFLDGQLEECELTLKDLHEIGNSFSHILTAFFHQRIDYSLPPMSGPAIRKSDEDLDSKSAKTYLFRPKKN